jgi:cytochrome c oxidase assembly protein subunit 15
MALIGVAVALVLFVRRDGQPPSPSVGRAPVLLVRLTFAAAWLVLYAGTVVTGSGPHAGDRNAPRTGLDPAAVSQLHANLVFLLIGLTAGSLFALRAAGAVKAALAASWLLGIELAQGVVGFVQYFTDLPVLLVGVHLLGAAAVSACATWLLLSVPSSVPGDPVAAPEVRHQSEVLAEVAPERE